jgi:hypothetical protein
MASSVVQCVCQGPKNESVKMGDNDDEEQNPVLVIALHPHCPVFVYMAQCVTH